MTTRKFIPKNTESDVLTKSRRRCCLCFGLNFDSTEKQGQIAHLDHDPANNAPSNLAFLCFAHHDKFDSTSSQSKGITRREVEHYRDELYRLLRIVTSGPISKVHHTASLDERLAIVGAFPHSPRRESESEYATQQTEDLLSRLLGAIQGWYDEIIDGIEELSAIDGSFGDRKEFKFGIVYVWRRRYIQTVVAIMNAIEDRPKMRRVANAVDAFLEALTVDDYWRREPGRVVPAQLKERRRLGFSS